MPMLKKKVDLVLLHQYFRNVLPSPQLSSRPFCTAVPFSYAPLHRNAGQTDWAYTEEKSSPLCCEKLEMF